MGIDVVDHRDAGPQHERSAWSAVVVAAAGLAWVGGILVHVLGVLGPAVAGAGVAAGVVAGWRERRPVWRVITVVATLACFAALSLYALVLTSTVSWPPTG